MSGILVRTKVKQVIRCLRQLRARTNCGLRSGKESIIDRPAPFVFTWKDLIAAEAIMPKPTLLTEPTTVFDPMILNAEVMDDFCLDLMELGEDVDILGADELLVYEIHDS